MNEQNAAARRVYVVVGEVYGETSDLLGVFVDDRAGAERLVEAWKTHQGYEYDDLTVCELADWAGLAPVQAYQRVTVLHPDGTPDDAARDLKDNVCCGPVPVTSRVSPVSTRGVVRSYMVTARGVAGPELDEAHDGAVARARAALAAGDDPTEWFGE